MQHHLYIDVNGTAKYKVVVVVAIVFKKFFIKTKIHGSQSFTKSFKSPRRFAFWEATGTIWMIS